jgi:hypothetical protein
MKVWPDGPQKITAHRDFLTTFYKNEHSLNDSPETAIFPTIWHERCLV